MKVYQDFAKNHLDVRSNTNDEWLCLCPYHKDSNPSFAFNVYKGVFICYACGAKGTYKQLAQHLNVVVDSATTYASVDLVKSKLAAIKEPPKVAPEAEITPEWLQIFRFEDNYLRWWADRGITKQSVLDAFCLGYSEIEHQLIIPVHRPTSSRVTSVIRRNIDKVPGRPKYLYYPGFKISHCLYGSYQVRAKSTSGRLPAVAITEGSIDTLAMWQVGVPSVALLGARVSSTQAFLLKALDPIQFVVMTDRDAAGLEAASKINEALKGAGIIISHPTEWQAGKKDPAELSESERLKAFCSAQ